MSSSPKYSTPSLLAVVVVGLLAEHERWKAREQVRRQEEERRRRQERLAHAQRKAQQDVASILLRLEEAEREGFAQFVGSEIQSIKKRLQLLSSKIGHAVDEPQLNASNADLHRLRNDFQQVMARGGAAMAVLRLAQEEAALNELRYQIAALDRQQSEKFDPKGLAEVEDLISEADSALKNKDLQEVTEITAKARTRFERHQADVEKQFNQWAGERDRACSAVAQADDRLSGLRIDEEVMRWAGPEVQAMDEQLGKLSALIEAERFNEAVAAAAAVIRMAEDAIVKSQDLQLKEEKRQYIVSGIVQVMKQLGFVVQAGYPAPEYPDVPSSATIIQAQRLGGGALAVSIPQDGEVWYDAAGYPMRIETGSDGQQVNTCDEAEEQIQRMHAALSETFGIEMSELLWSGKDPDRIHKAADSLPDSTHKSGPHDWGV